MKKTIYPIVAALCLCMIFSACGKKGDDSSNAINAKAVSVVATASEADTTTTSLFEPNLTNTSSNVVTTTTTTAVTTTTTCSEESSSNDNSSEADGSREEHHNNTNDGGNNGDGDGGYEPSYPPETQPALEPETTTTPQQTTTPAPSPTTTTAPQRITATRLSMSKYQIDLEIGQNSSVSPVVEPANAEVSYTWSSNRTDRVRVDAHGGLYAVSSGSAIITVKDEITGLSASCMVTVK